LITPGAAPQGFDFGRGGLRRGAVAVEIDHHIRAVAGEMQGDGAPMPAPAGDEGNFVVEEGHEQASGMRIWQSRSVNRQGIYQPRNRESRIARHFDG